MNILTKLLLSLFLVFFSFASFAKDNWPSKSLTLIVPNAPGSTIDISARYIARQLAPKLNQSVIVKNQPGAGGIIAARSLANAEPDGYTFMVNSTVFVTGNQFLYKNLGYNEDNFLPVTGISKVSFVLLVPGNSPNNSVSDLISFIKNNTAYYGTSITTSHTMAAEFLRDNSIQATRIAYSNSAAVSRDLASGIIDFLFIDAGTGIGLIKNNFAKPLMVTSEVRLTQLSSVPTALEENMKNLLLSSPINLYAPRGVDKNIVEQLHNKMQSILSDDETAKFLFNIGAAPYFANSGQISNDHSNHTIYWKRAIAAAGIEAQ